jgi:hypothetical protein
MEKTMEKKHVEIFLKCLNKRREMLKDMEDYIKTNADTTPKLLLDIYKKWCNYLYGRILLYKTNHRYKKAKQLRLAYNIMRARNFKPYYAYEGGKFCHKKSGNKQ